MVWLAECGRLWLPRACVGLPSLSMMSNITLRFGLGPGGPCRKRVGERARDGMGNEPAVARLHDQRPWPRRGGRDPGFLTQLSAWGVA